MFPNLPDLLAGNSTASLGEVLPEVGRDLDFRVTVRDGNGGVNSDDIKLEVVNTGSAFAVNSLPSSVTGGSTQTVTWNVAGTDSGIINASDVEIWLSTDGGVSFGTLLATTANDGSANVTLPNIDAASARIRINPVGNVFFAINDANFSIAQSSTAPGVTIAAGLISVAEDGVVAGVSTGTYQLKLNTVPNGTVTIEVTGDDDIELSADGTNFSASLTLALVDDSTQTITVRAVDDTVEESFEDVTITHAITASTSADYPTTLAINPVDVTVVDDELHPLTGVVFSNDGTNPTNWNESRSTFNGQESNLLREDGVVTSTGLEIFYQSGSGNGLGAYSGPTVLAQHDPALDSLNGLRFSTGVQNFTWTGLMAGQTYDVYVLLTENFGDTIDQTVTITGEMGMTPIIFGMDTTNRNRQLHINGDLPNGSSTVRASAVQMVADGAGEIDLSIVKNSGQYSAVSALAIAPVVDNTQPVTITVTNQDANAEYLESGGQVNLLLTRDGDTTETLMIDVTVDVAGEFTFPAVVTFPEGSATATFTADTINDFDIDGNINFSFTFGRSPLTEQANFTGIVLDDDLPVLSVSVDPASLTEGNTGTATVTRSGDTGRELVVTLTTDTPDRLGIPSTATIPAGASSATFSVTATDDVIVNGNVTATINATTGPEIGFDTSFGTAGAASVSAVENEFFFVPTNGENLVQADGKIVTVYNRQREKFNLVRFNPDGSPDTSFGNNGFVQYEYEMFVGTFETPGDVVQTPDGKLVVSFIRGRSTLSPPNIHYLVRFNTNGSVDTSFGNAGVVQVDAGARGLNSQIVALADGSVITSATRTITGGEEYYVKRVLPSGTIDSAYDDVAVRDLRQGAPLVALADGSVFVASRVPVGQSQDTKVVKLRPGGGTDPTFGNAGVVLLESPDATLVSDIAVDSSGRIVLFGARGANGDNDAEVIRLLADGTLDNSFGTGGFARIADPTTSAFAERGAVDSNGNVLFSSNSTAQVETNFFVLDSNGALRANSVGLVTGNFAGSVFDIDFDANDRALFSNYLSDYRVFRLEELIIPPSVPGSTTVTVVDNDPLELTLSLANASINETGSTTLQVGLVNVSATDTTVTLSSSDVGEATLPASVVIPAGQLSVDVTISGVEDSLLDGDQAITLNGSIDGVDSDSIGLTVVDTTPTVMTLDLPQGFVIAENTGTLTVNVGLSAQATSDVTISLSATDPTALTFPATVTVPAFSSGTSFTVTAVDNSDYTMDRQVTLQADGGHLGNRFQDPFDHRR